MLKTPNLKKVCDTICMIIRQYFLPFTQEQLDAPTEEMLVLFDFLSCVSIMATGSWNTNNK